MLYHIVKPFVRIFLRVYYKLDYSGIAHIPFGKPVVLAPNHVNAFVDPVLIAMLPKHKVRFFARGDVFKGKLAKAALNSLNISPMYRIQEGFSEIKKNDKTFEECRSLLTADKTILLFPEGICVQEKRLRPLKKGMARIVFQTAQSLNYSKDIFVVPVGLNYEDAKRFRSKVFIHFGRPVPVSTYIEQFKAEPVRTINDFTKQFEQHMKQYMVIINNPENDVLADNVIEMFLKDWLVEKEKDTSKLINEYEGTKEIIAMINYFDEQNKQELEKIKHLVEEYFLLLNTYDLRDHLLHADTISKSNFGTFFMEFAKLYLGFPIYVLGLIMNFPPYYIAKAFSNEKIKQVEFYASVYANVAMILWLIYYPLQLLMVALTFKSWMLVGVYSILVPLTGIYVLEFYPMMKKVLGRWRLLRLVRKNKDVVQQMVDLRGAIIHQFEKMKEVFLIH